MVHCHDDHSRAWLVCAALWLAAWLACIAGAVALWRWMDRWEIGL